MFKKLYIITFPELHKWYNFKAKILGIILLQLDF